CHPRVIMMAVRIGGAMAGPHFEPESQIAVACPRSERGNQSAVRRALAGPFGASAAPSRNRNVTKCHRADPIDINAVAMDQPAMARKYILRAPSLSTSHPAGSCAN